MTNLDTLLENVTSVTTSGKKRKQDNSVKETGKKQKVQQHKNVQKPSNDLRNEGTMFRPKPMSNPPGQNRCYANSAIQSFECQTYI